jgi:hypothetical protein
MKNAFKSLTISVPQDDIEHRSSMSSNSSGSDQEEEDVVGELPVFPLSARAQSHGSFEFPLEPSAAGEYVQVRTSRCTALKVDVSSSDTSRTSTPTRRLLADFSVVPKSPSFLISPRPKEKNPKLFSPGISRESLAVRRAIKSPRHQTVSSTVTNSGNSTPRSASSTLSRMVLKEPRYACASEAPTDTAATRIGRIRERIQQSSSRGRSGSVGLKEDQVGSLEQLKQRRSNNALVPFNSSSTISSADMTSHDEALSMGGGRRGGIHEKDFGSLASSDVEYRVIGVQYELI